MAIERVGSAGRFQKCAASIVAFTFTLTGNIIYGLAFLEKGPTYICKDGSECEKDVACAEGYQDLRYDLHNWNKALGLQCESEERMGAIGSTFFVGFMIGAILFLRLSDIVGRKYVTIGAYLVHIIAVVILLAAKNLETIYVALFLLGLKSSPNGQVPYIQILEFVSKDKRNLCGMFMMSVDGSFVLLLAFYYALVPDYRPLLLYNLSIAILLTLLYIFCVYESPRFYVSRKKFRKARVVFEKIARRNGRKMFQEPLQGEEQMQQADSNDESFPEDEGLENKKQNEKNGICDLLRAGKRTVVPLVIMSLNWFIATMVYYGITFGLQFMNNVNLFVLGIVQALAELIGVVSSAFWANRLGRKRAIICNHLCLGLACFSFQLALYLSAPSWVYLVCILVGKYCSTAGFNIIYLITSELFPTNFRGTVFGITNFVARIGGILAPLIDYEMQTSFMFVFTISSFVSVIISFFLSETKGKQIPDTLQQSAPPN